MDTMRINLRRFLMQGGLPDQFRASATDLRAFGEQLMGMQFQGLVSGKIFSRDACANYLADHLDAALDLADRIAGHALGPNQEIVTEDREHDGSWVMGGDAIVIRFAEIRTYVHDLKTFELALTTKLSQARIWAERVQRHDPRLDRVASLLLTGTHAFIDAGARQADTTDNDFNSSDPTLVYLRTRGIVDEDVVSLDEIGTLMPGYAFRIWGGVSLYNVSEMMNAFLGAADVHYNLYEADEDNASTAPDDSAETEPDSINETVSGGDDTDLSDEPVAGADDADDLTEPDAVMGALEPSPATVADNAPAK